VSGGVDEKTRANQDLPVSFCHLKKKLKKRGGRKKRDEGEKTNCEERDSCLVLQTDEGGGFSLIIAKRGGLGWTKQGKKGGGYIWRGEEGSVFSHELAESRNWRWEGY